MRVEMENVLISSYTVGGGGDASETNIDSFVFQPRESEGGGYNDMIMDDTAGKETTLEIRGDDSLISNLISFETSVDPTNPNMDLTTVVENVAFEVYDWPGEYAQRFDGIDA
jgi:hypothetical protein